MLGEQLLRMLAGVLVGIWVARYLGPEQFGIFSYVFAFVALFSSVAKLGLDSIVVRDLVGNPEGRNVYLGTAFWLKFLGAVFTLFFVCIASAFTTNNFTTNLYIFIVASGIIFQSFEVIDFYFQSKILVKFVSICRIIQLLFSSLVRIYLVLSGQDLFWFVVVTLIDQVVLALSLYLAYRLQKIGSFYHYFNLAIAKKMLSDSWPLIFSGLIVMLYMRIDQIMIKEMLGEKEVGFYSAAVRLSEVWYFIPMLITQSVFPAIVSAKRINEDLYIVRLQRLYTFLVWVAILVALPMTFLSNAIVVFLYGAAYQNAGSVLAIHIWAGVFVSLGVVSSSWLINENMQRVTLYRTLSGAIVNVVLNLVLIPIYGLLGAAIATVISYTIAGLLFDLFNKKTRIMFRMKVNAILFKGIRIGY